MHRGALVLAVVAGCSSPAMREEPEDPAVLARMLEDGDPLRREEAAQRLVRLGWTVEEARRNHAEPSIDSMLPSTLDEVSLKSKLGRALEERDPQRIVWRAYHAARVGCLGREWNRIRAGLIQQGIQFRERYEPDVRSHSQYERFLARSAAYANGAGDKHDLFFWVHSVRRGETDPWVVREVYVGLHATFETDFKTLAESDRYPRGSVLAQFFEHPEARKLASAFPILEELELIYGRLRDKESETIPAGFLLNAGFAMRSEGKSGGRGVTYVAESGLDPRETRGGRFVWDGFSPSDARGPLLLRGNSFWGAGGLKPPGD